MGIDRKAASHRGLEIKVELDNPLHTLGMIPTRA